MAGSVVSDIVAVGALFAISITVLLLLRHYLPLRSTPAYLLVPVFLALALPCSIILLVPIDLASIDSGNKHTRGIWLNERVLLVTWRITYWLTFLLTWFMLPLLGEYCDSGYRDTRSRVIDSARSNLRYQLIVLGTGTAGLVYFILQNGFHGSSIKGLVMALAYAWGLILGLGLMGHGMVALPRRLFKNAHASERLRRLQAQAPRTREKLDEATEQLEQLENTITQLKQRKHGTSRNLQEWIDELADTAALPESRPGATAAVRATNVNIPAVVTERYLADLTRKFKRAKHKKTRFIDEWTTLCQRAQDTQTILDAASSQQLDFGRERSISHSLLGQHNFLTPTMRYTIYARIVPALRIALAAFFAVASALVIYSEVASSFTSKLSVIGLTVVHHKNSEAGRVGLAGQVIAAAWLFYMDACALYAIADVKVWGNRALVKRQTYSESACWYSLQVAKLTVPLSYNFITMMPRDVYKDTSFYAFLGKLINLTPLGTGFSAFFPCFLLIPVLMTLFNVYGKIKSVVGFGVLEDESENNPSGFGTGGWREGRALIDRELQQGGEGGGNVGLASRGGESLDYDRRGPVSSTAGTSSPSRTGVPQRANQTRNTVGESEGTMQARRTFNSVTNQEEEEDDGARHFYQDFTERVRNTFDTVERPEWVQNLSAGFKTPKWMQNDRQESAGAQSGGLSRWFGGRAEDGRVRL
ncbi:hypothetical protein MBLNU230_g0297t1 [Neophaeotheca triangularis]